MQYDNPKITEINKFIELTEKDSFQGSSKITNILIKFLKANAKEKFISIKRNKLYFNQNFYLELRIYLNEQDFELSEQSLHQYFKYLIDYKFISAYSDYFIRKKYYSINQTHSNLNDTDYNLLEQLDDFQLYLKEKLNNEEYLFAYLFLFHLSYFTKKELETIDTNNMFICNNQLCIIFFQDILSFNTDFKKYYIKLVPLKFCNIKPTLESKLLFQDKYVNYLSKIKTLYAEFFKSNLNVFTFRNTIKTDFLFDTSGLELTLRTNVLKSISPTFRELHFLYGNVPQSFLEIDDINLSIVKTDNDNYNDDFNDDEAEKLEEIDFNEDIKPNLFITYEKKKDLFYKHNYKTEKEKNSNLEKTIEILKSKSFQATYTESSMYDFYILLIQKHFKGEINYSTLGDYIGIINKDLFSKYLNFKNLDQAKFEAILIKLQNSSKSENTIKKIKSVFNTFSQFILNLKISIKIESILLRKSMVFYKEIDKILEEIEKYYATFIKTTQSKNLTYMLLQDKAMILLYFYTGARKMELITSKLKDIFLINENIYLDINLKNKKNTGIKSKDSLKSNSAKRHVKASIKNLAHLNIIQDFLKRREQYKTNSISLFLDRNFGFINDKDIHKIVIYKNRLRDKNISYLNKILQKVTHRYVTLHSLRHSFTTYRVIDILNNKSSITNDALINLSNELGHNTCDVSIEQYLHIELFMFNLFGVNND